MDKFKFEGKYIITADLRCMTGLHIGGTQEGFEIGGIDNPVIKDPITGYPYIPGSSLKGKMRSLLEWSEQRVKPERDNAGKWTAPPCKCGTCDVCVIFGSSANAEVTEGPTRLTVRDASPKEDTVEDWKKFLGEKIYTELKTENTIDRLTSEANPRSMERIPANSVFCVEMVYDIYQNNDLKKLKKLFEAMHLLEDSTLGGGGSRGAGQIIFENFNIKKRSLEYYHGEKTAGESIDLKGHNTAKAIKENFETIFNLQKGENKSADTSNQSNP